MNIYEKIQAVRVELQNSNIKKSGLNKFAGYSYHELGDFLPIINVLCQKHKLFTYVSFKAEFAVLIIIDMDEPNGNQVAITSPMADAQLKGCHPIQNMGAVQTYQRRYLYMAAFEIVEHDALDATTEPQKATPPPKSATKAETPTTRPQITQEKPVDMAKWWAQVGKLGLGDKEVHDIAGRESLKGMSREELTDLYAKCKIVAAEKKGEI